MKRVMQVIKDRTQQGHTAEGDSHTLWLGDFNLHHLLWGESHNSHLFMRGNLDKAQCLIDATAELDFQAVLPRNLPTLQVMSSGNHTRQDNILHLAQHMEAIT